MAISMVGMVSPGSGLAGRWRRKRAERGGGVRCSAASSVAAGGLMEQYRTLRIRPEATETEVKRAFRQLALQYHPDVCKGSNCGVQFHQINAAYDIIMDNLRQAEEVPENLWAAPEWSEDGYGEEPMRGMCDSSWDMWEEWMGWEGAGIRDYSSHINPYI